MTGDTREVATAGSVAFHVSLTPDRGIGFQPMNAAASIPRTLSGQPVALPLFAILCSTLHQEQKQDQQALRPLGRIRPICPAGRPVTPV